MVFLKRKIIFLFMVSFSLFPLYGMWNNERHLYTQGLFDSLPDDKKLYSPVVGMVLLESNLGQEICLEGASVEEGEGDEGGQTTKVKTPRGQLANNILQNLDGNIRRTARPINPFHTISSKQFGALVDTLIGRDTDDSIEKGIDYFLTTNHGENWKRDHGLKGGFGSSKFKKNVKKLLSPLKSMNSKDKSRVFSMFAAASSSNKISEEEGDEESLKNIPGLKNMNNKEALADYYSGLTGIDNIESYEKYDLNNNEDLQHISVEKLIASLIDSQLSSYQKLSPKEQLYADYKDHKKVAICAEQSLWGVINIILYNRIKDELEVSLLPNDISIRDDFKEFIERHKSLKTLNYYNQEAIDQFMNLVSGIPTISYVHKADRYELETNKSTALNMINYIFNLNVETLAECGQKLSTDSRKVTFEDHGKNVEGLSVNDSDQDYTINAEWNFSEGHAYLQILITEKKLIVDYIKSIMNYSLIYPDIPVVSLASNHIEEALGMDDDKFKETGFDTKIDFLKKLINVPSLNLKSMSIQGRSVLHFLLEKDEIDAAQVLVNHGADINSINPYEYVRNNLDAKVKFLLDNGADAHDILQTAMFKGFSNDFVGEKEAHKNIINMASLRITDEQRNSMIDSAIDQKRFDFAEMLLDHNPNLDRVWEKAIKSEIPQDFLRALNKKGSGPSDLPEKITLLQNHGIPLDTIMYDAIEMNNQAQIDYLLKEKKVKPTVGLVGSVHYNNKPMVDSMLEKGANIELGLLQSVFDNNEQMITLMFEKGAKGSPQTLAESVMKKNYQLVEKLLKNNINISKSMVRTAIKNDDLKMVALLLNHKGEIDSSMVEEAIESDDLAMVKLLLSHDGVRVDNGMMNQAFRSNNKELMDLLYTKGARANSDLLTSAAQSNDLEKAQIAVKYGARVEDGFGSSDVLEYALENDNLEMAKLLLSNGAKKEHTTMFMLKLNQSKYLNDAGYKPGKFEKAESLLNQAIEEVQQ